MPQKGLAAEKVEELRSLRSEGLSVREVAARAGVSQGAVSNYTRDIAKPARSPQAKKGAVKQPAQGKGIMAPVAGAKMDEETVELVGRVRKARLQQELDEVEDRKRQRQEIEDLRIRERKLLLQLDETRLGAAKGDSAVVGEITQLRSELGELREARHQAEMRASEDRHAGEVRRLEQQIAVVGRTGRSPYDLMSEGMGKIENLIGLAGDKVDRFMRDNKDEQHLLRGLSLGISPEGYQRLLRGPETIPSYEEYCLGRQIRAHRSKETYEEPSKEEYQGYVGIIERNNRQYQAISDRVAQRLGQGGVSVVKTGKPGRAPEPGQAESAVLKAESKLVTCSRCGTTFDIDLVEARQSAAAGRKLFVHCANPKCNFLLDLADLIPELQLKPEPKLGDEFICPQCHTVTELLAVGGPICCANRQCQRHVECYSWNEVKEILAGEREARQREAR